MNSLMVILSMSKWNFRHFLFFFILLMPNPLFSINFPDLFFMNFAPDFNFSLVNIKTNGEIVSTNRLDVESRVNLPDDESVKIFFVNWILRLNLDNQRFIYLLRFKIKESGDIYLTEIKDTLYDSNLLQEILIFPVNIVYQKPIPIGLNISLKYVKRLSSLTVNNRLYNDIITAELNFSEKVWTIYFARNNGIIGMKSDTDIFRIK